MYATRLHEVSFRPKLCVAFNFGGHMGPTNRVFVCREDRSSAEGNNSVNAEQTTARRAQREAASALLVSCL